MCSGSTWQASLVGRCLTNQKIIFSDSLESIGARAFITTLDGRKSYVREVFNATGMSTDQWMGLTFGLGQQDKITKAVITWPDGYIKTLDNPAINHIIMIKK